MICVLDASAMQAFLRAEVGGEIVRDLLDDAASICYAHAINLCEVFYDFHRDSGEHAAQAVLRQLLAAPIILREDIDRSFWQQAGRHKSVYRRVSLADCFAVTLAQRLGGELITADRHELTPIATAGLCPVRFIR